MGTASHRSGAAASSADRPAREFDLVVLAPTGYQGRRVVKEVHALLGGQGRRLAAAGRDAERLAAVQESVGAGASFTVLGGCDAANANAMRALAARTSALLSCCGNFAATGPALVAACVEAGTHYLDASLGCHMESVDQLWRQLRREHHATAAANGALVINSLGFDTVLADFAVLDLARLFVPPLPAAIAIESYLSLKASKGYVLRKTTWLQHTTGAPKATAAAGEEEGESAAHGSDSEGGDRLLSYCQELQCWSVPGAASEAPLVLESQALLREQAARQGVQPPCPSTITYAARLPLPSPVFAGLYLLKKGVTWLAGKAGSVWGGGGGGGSWMASDTAVRLVTGLGLVTEDDSRFEESDRAKTFRKTFVARATFAGAASAGSTGMAQGRAEGGSAAGGAPTTHKSPSQGGAGQDAGQEVHILTVSGPSPGYDVTPASLALAAAVLLEEGSRVSSPGGFSTPAAALRSTSFWPRLQERCGLVVGEGR